MKADLHNLIKTHGARRVAEVMGISPTCIPMYRAGLRRINIDHLYRLQQVFVEFGVVETVQRCGAARVAKGRA
jgi:hypothetical protein